MDPNSTPSIVDRAMQCLTEVLSENDIQITIDNSNGPNAPEVVLPSLKKFVVGEGEVLFVREFNKFTNDYKYDIYYLDYDFKKPDLRQWILSRVLEN